MGSAITVERSGPSTLKKLLRSPQSPTRKRVRNKWPGCRGHFQNKERKPDMKRFIGWLFGMTLLFASITALGQTATTGSVEGVVSDPNGAAVKGATVSVTSPNLISPQTATTDDNGRFRVLALPPGAYKVTVEASGFAPFEKDNIAVNLGRTSNTDAQLGLASASATVTVTSGSAVDSAQNTTGSNISSTQFSNFPTQRTVQ